MVLIDFFCLYISQSVMLKISCYLSPPARINKLVSVKFIMLIMLLLFFLDKGKRRPKQA